MTEEKDTDQNRIEILIQEYLILQTKIDNYGSNSFKIKAIIIPLASAAIYLILKEERGVLAFFALIGTLALLYYEAINNIYKGVLSERARYVERLLKYPGIRKKRFSSPHIAHALIARNLITLKNIFISLISERRTNIIYFILILVFVILMFFYGI